MKVAFRADASIDIGTGHVMRCLTLAEALRQRGAECLFVCREHPGNLIAQIQERGFRTFALPSGDGVSSDGTGRPVHAGWLQASVDTDARQTREALAGSCHDWLVVDHYAIDAEWEGRLRPSCDRILVIDDLADRRHDCDLLLDQNLGRRREDYAPLVSARCEVLVGPAHALLRPEFAAVRGASLVRRQTVESIRHLLIAMGGVDKDNATAAVLASLVGSALPVDCRISVVMGSNAPWLDDVRVKAASLTWPVDVRVDVRNMADLMADADLAIGAAGTTAWERCCVGLPCLTLVLADNQRSGAAALAAAGAVAVVEGGPGLAGNIRAALGRLCRSEVLHGMQHACAALTEGKGAAMLADMLTGHHG